MEEGGDITVKMNNKRKKMITELGRSRNEGIKLVMPATANKKKRTVDEVLVRKKEEGKIP